jgi:hypothetical protein
MKLVKEWIWKPEASIYEHSSQVVHYAYPFYWYRVYGNEIELVKQISKNVGIVQDWNSLVQDQPEVVAPEVVSSIEDMYVDHRSWLTLGEVSSDPIDQVAEFTWGDTTTKLEYTPDGQLYSVRHYVDGKIVYVGQYSYAKKKDRYFATRYQNSLGVECNKIDKGWNWISGKPVIEKKYGKRK